MRTLWFSGYIWMVKQSEEPVGPGPNLFGSGPQNVAVDRRGRLHLRITQSGDQWICAEVINSRSLGYGTYRFYLQTDVTDFDPNVVLGLFTWSDNPAYAHREIDIEFAQWGERGAPNAQYVVQPAEEGRYIRFRMPRGVARSVHSFHWEPGSVGFSSRSGWDAERGKILYAWTFRGGDIPVPGDENPRINLWLYQGRPPTDGREVEVIIAEFQFVPLSARWRTPRRALA